MSSFEKFCLYGGTAIAAIGLIMMIAGNVFLGIIAIIAGIAMVLKHFSKKKQIEVNRQNIETQFEEKRKNGIQIIRATLAEVVDFRAEFAEKDGESQTIDFQKPRLISWKKCSHGKRLIMNPGSFPGLDW